MSLFTKGNCKNRLATAKDSNFVCVPVHHVFRVSIGQTGASKTKNFIWTDEEQDYMR